MDEPDKENYLGYFILKTKRAQTILNNLSNEEMGELLKAILDYIKNGVDSPQNNIVSMAFEILLEDHYEMVDEFFE